MPFRKVRRRLVVITRLRFFVFTLHFEVVGFYPAQGLLLLFSLIGLSVNLTIEGSMNAISFLIKNRNFIGFESCFEKSDEFFPIIIMTRNNEKL